MSLLARFEQTGEGGERRASDRRALRLAITASLPESPQSAVTIHDLSVSGMLIESSAPLAEGERFQVFLPLIGGVDATVVWNSGNFYGCQFGELVPQSAVSAALLKSVPKDLAGGSAGHGSGDLLSQLRDLNAQVDDLGAQLDRTIDRIATGGRGKAVRHSSSRVSAVVEPDPSRGTEPRRYSEPAGLNDGDAGRSIVIFMLILAGLAVLMLAVAMLGSPLLP